VVGKGLSLPISGLRVSSTDLETHTRVADGWATASKQSTMKPR
jgi:hypothetical protein